MLISFCVCLDCVFCYCDVVRVVFCFRGVNLFRFVCWLRFCFVRCLFCLFCAADVTLLRLCLLRVVCC